MHSGGQATFSGFCLPAAGEERAGPLFAFSALLDILSGQALDNAGTQLRPFFIEDERSGDNGLFLSADRASQIHHAMQLNVQHRVWPLQACLPQPAREAHLV